MIETRALTRVFKSRKQTVEAVKGIDLAVREGEIFGFLGPNGAGKTTTLRMLATLLPPSGGDATVAGADLRHEPGKVRQRIGYIGQRGGTDPMVTGRDEIVLQCRLYGMPRNEAQRRAGELIRTLELEDCAERKTGTYSGGQRRRLDIGIGLAHRPQLLFMDEPTTGLDPQSRARMWEEIARLRTQGTTVFITTHYLDEADALCDRLAIIDHGTIVAGGTPDELKRQVAGDVVTIGVDDPGRALPLIAGEPWVREAGSEDGQIRLYVERGEAAMPQILRILDRHGITLNTLALHRPSLDDVFLRQTGRSLREGDEHAA
jgi:ABC-2 type transport system ATP-binding protein